MSTNVKTIPRSGGPRVQVGLCHRYRRGEGSEGPERRHHPPDLGQEERARLHAGVAAEGVSALGVAGTGEAEPKWANIHYRPHRLPGHHLLLGARSRSRAEEPGRSSIPEILRTYEKLGIPLEEQKHARRRRGGRGLRQRLRGDHLQGEAGGDGRHLLLVLRSGAEASRAGARSTWARSCPTPTTFLPR